MKETMKKVMSKAPPPENDNNEVYRFLCDKGDTKYRSTVTLNSHLSSSVSNGSSKPNIPTTNTGT